MRVRKTIKIKTIKIRILRNNKNKACVHGNYDFAEISKNLARNRSENNFIGPSK